MTCVFDGSWNSRHAAAASFCTGLSFVAGTLPMLAVAERGGTEEL
jgi:hypothetical protein